jgi:hybrid cluster-associated redox disulfide protein
MPNMPKTLKAKKPEKTIKKGKELRDQAVKKIIKTDNLADAVFKYPQIAEILNDYGLHCVGCFAAAYDSIEEGAKVHGMEDGVITEMLERINEVVNFRE